MYKLDDLVIIIIIIINIYHYWCIYIDFILKNIFNYKNASVKKKLVLKYIFKKFLTV